MNEIVRVIAHLLALLYYWLESMVLFFVPLRFKAKDISEDLVLITGAGSGIGRKMAIKFAERGADVVLWDVNDRGNEETAKMVREKGQKAYSYVVDVTNKTTVYQAAARVKREAGVVTILINNAGIVAGKSFLQLDDKMVEKVFAVNVMSHFWTIKAFLPGMLQENRGHLVTISSLAGLGGMPKLADYCASKFAAIGLLESLMIELHSEHQRNIHFTTICPAFINTGLFDGAQAKLFDVLDPGYVAEEVVKGVLCNKSIVLIPRAFYSLFILKSLIPTKALMSLHDALGGSDCMEDFRGRTPKIE